MRDATNSVRLCIRCENEQGIGAGADAGDTACAACGSHEANNVYVPETELAVATEALQEIFDIEGDGGPGMIAGDALRELGII